MGGRINSIISFALKSFNVIVPNIRFKANPYIKYLKKQPNAFFYSILTLYLTHVNSHTLQVNYILDKTRMFL